MRRLLTVLALAKGAAKHRDVLVDIPFFNKLLRPYRTHEIFLFHQMTVVFDQDQEDVEYLGSQRNRLTVTQQRLFRGVKPKRAELIQLFLSPAHNRVQEKFGKNSESGKDIRCRVDVASPLASRHLEMDALRNRLPGHFTPRSEVSEPPFGFS